MSGQSRFRLLTTSFSCLAIAFAATCFDFGQDYTAQEYDEYQRAVEGGPDALVAWYTANPDSALREYVVPKFIEWVRTQVGEGDYRQAIATGETFLSKIDGEHVDMLQLTTYSAYNAGLWDKAARYGEKVYQAKPETPDVLEILANSYLRLRDTPKTVEYGEVFCAEASPEKCCFFYPVIAGYYAERKEWAKAETYARKVIEAVDAAKQPAGISEEEWSKYAGDSKADAISIMGKGAYERQAWQSAQSAYKDLLVLSAGNDERRAEAHFYIGMTHWRLEEFTPAMIALAQGSQLKGATMAKHCRVQLEVLYRATHNGSLAGLDVLLEEHPPD